MIPKPYILRRCSRHAKPEIDNNSNITPILYLCFQDSAQNSNSHKACQKCDLWERALDLLREVDVREVEPSSSDQFFSRSFWFYIPGSTGFFLLILVWVYGFVCLCKGWQAPTNRSPETVTLAGPSEQRHRDLQRSDQRLRNLCLGFGVRH